MTSNRCNISTGTTTVVLKRIGKIYAVPEQHPKGDAVLTVLKEGAIPTGAMQDPTEKAIGASKM